MAKSRDEALLFNPISFINRSYLYVILFFVTFQQAIIISTPPCTVNGKVRMLLTFPQAIPADSHPLSSAAKQYNRNALGVQTKGVFHIFLSAAMCSKQGFGSYLRGEAALLNQVATVHGDDGSTQIIAGVGG